MTYTKRNFGSDLLNEVNRGYDVVRLARWAMRLRSDRIREFDEGVKDAVMDIVVMEEGPEFEMTEEQLRDFAQRLMGEQHRCREP